MGYNWNVQWLQNLGVQDGFEMNKMCDSANLSKGRGLLMIEMHSEMICSSIRFKPKLVCISQTSDLISYIFRVSLYVLKSFVWLDFIVFPCGLWLNLLDFTLGHH